MYLSIHRRRAEIDLGEIEELAMGDDHAHHRGRLFRLRRALVPATLHGGKETVITDTYY